MLTGTESSGPRTFVHVGGVTWSAPCGDAKLILVHRRKSQSVNKPSDRFTVRACAAAFQLLDTMYAEPGLFGQCFLRQASREAVLAQQILEQDWRG